MGGLQKYFIIHSLPVFYFCCLFVNPCHVRPVHNLGHCPASFSSSTLATLGHCEVGGDVKSCTGNFLTDNNAFNLWETKRRRNKVHLMSRVEWPLDHGWFMISRGKVSRTDCFPPVCLRISMFELNAYKRWDIVGIKVTGWFMWSQKTSVLH